jgi:hypothetical protein
MRLQCHHPATGWIQEKVLLALPQSVLVPGELTAAIASRSEHCPSSAVNSSVFVVTSVAPSCRQNRFRDRGARPKLSR